jgi:hypothetical protein
LTGYKRLKENNKYWAIENWIYKELAVFLCSILVVLASFNYSHYLTISMPTKLNFLVDSS